MEFVDTGGDLAAIEKTAGDAFATSIQNLERYKHNKRGSLCESNRRALLHLTALARDGDSWPDVELIVSVARNYDAQASVVVAGFGWTPGGYRALTEQEKIALKLSQQLFLGLAWQDEIGD